MSETNLNDLEFISGLSADVILKAVAGDNDALATVLEAFDPFIRQQSMVKDENGEHYDEDMAQHLRMVMLEKIKDFKISE